MSNIHANLINNATNMQSQLLEFSHQLSNLSLKSLEDQASFKMTAVPEFKSGTLDSSLISLTEVKIVLPGAAAGTTVDYFILIGDAGLPLYSDTAASKYNTSTTKFDSPTAIASATSPQATAAQAMAVVAMNLKGVGLSNANIKSIFEQGITPTSLAAVESQLKGHHDAVLQLALESLSRVTSVLSKIAQKLSQ